MVTCSSSLLLFLKALLSECTAVQGNGQTLWVYQVLSDLGWKMAVPFLDYKRALPHCRPLMQSTGKAKIPRLAELWNLPFICTLAAGRQQPFLRQLMCCWCCTGASCWSRYKSHLSLKQIISVFSYDKHSLRANCYCWFENRLMTFLFKELF